MTRRLMPPVGLLALLAGKTPLGSVLSHDVPLGSGGPARKLSPGECPGCGRRISENKTMCLKCAKANGVETS